MLTICLFVRNNTAPFDFSPHGVGSAAQGPHATLECTIDDQETSCSLDASAPGEADGDQGQAAQDHRRDSARNQGEEAKFTSALGIQTATSIRAKQASVENRVCFQAKLLRENYHSVGVWEH